MINVTKSFMPPIEEYEEIINKIWDNRILTNEGPILKELVEKMKEVLNVDYINMVNNGTTAIELAIKALGIENGEIITTPFSFVATTSSIIWDNCKPVFVDIDEESLCIDANKIEKKINENTKAILVVHVFGIACDIEKIEEIAKKHNLKVIYDGAHAFGSEYRGNSLLSYGDVTTCSFHATKLFHTIEGGACFAKNKEINDKIQSMKTFGNIDGEYAIVGTNAKMTEFNAAMGLANLKYLEEIFSERKRITEIYDELLSKYAKRPNINRNSKYNYIYYPIIFKDETTVLNILTELNKNDINARRYFYPSLNTLKYLKEKYECPISEDISKRILCLPIYNGLKEDDVKKICKIILGVINKD